MRRVVAIGLAVVGAVVVLIALVCQGSESAGTRDGKRNASTRTTKAKPDPRALPRASVSGVVTREDGKPIAGASVCAVRSSTITAEKDTACGSTDAQGRYQVDGLIAGNYRVSASAERHVPASWQGPPPRWANLVALAPGEQRTKIDLVLRPGGVEVRGTVSDIGGGPVAEAWVRLSNVGAHGYSMNVAITRSRSDGTFSTWVAAGAMNGYAEADGYVGDFVVYTVAPTNALDLRLTPESVLTGTVVDAESGAAVAGARVSTSDGEVEGDGEGRSWVVAITDERGRFRLGGLKAGRYKPAATAPGLYGTPRTSVVVGIGQAVDGVVIPVHAASVVSGRVVVPDATGKAVGCSAPDVALYGRRSFHGTGDTDGSVQLDAVLPGTYRVYATCDGYVAAEQSGDLVVAGADISGLEWKLEAGGTLVVTVRTKAGATLRDASLEGHGLRQSDHVVAPDGTRTYSGVAPGQLELTAHARDYAATRHKVTVIAGKATRLDIVLEDAGGAVAGTIVDDSGKPVSGAYVSLHPGKAGSVHHTAYHERSREDGGFHVAGLQPGTYGLFVSRAFGDAMRRSGTTDDDDRFQTIEIAGRETVTLRIVVENESGWIAGTVVDAAGAPVSDAYVTASRETDGVKNRGELREKGHEAVVTDPSGAFRVNGLSPGSYTISASRRGGARGVVEHVALGSRSNRVVLKPTGSITGTVAIRAGPPTEEFAIEVTDANHVRRSERFFRTAGAFTLSDLPAGVLKLRVTASAGHAETTITLAEGERKTGVAIVLVPRLRVTGRVVALDDRAPVPGMRVSITGPDSSEEVEPAADGRFSVENIAAGPTEIYVRPIDFKDSPFFFAAIRRTLAGDGSVDLGDIAIPRRRPGELTGDLGFGVSDADPTALRAVQVRADGPAAKAGLVDGDQIVSIDGHDVTGDRSYLELSLLRVPPGTTVRLGLARGATLSITAVEHPRHK